MSNRELDVVVYGATGFTGKLVAEYLASNAPAGLRWAIAGRNPAKLAEVAASVTKDGVAPPTIVASADSFASLVSMATRTRVVLTTVGPYMKYGLPLVEACVAAGTDAVDLTGEPAFVKEVIARFHEPARAAKVRIVSCCGFDSIPHDLGVLHAVRTIRPHVPAAAALEVRGYLKATGGFSGGTWHSALGIFKDLGKKDTRGDGLRSGHDPSGRTIEKLDLGLHREPRVKSWGLPMPTIDPWMVRRSAHELEEYGPDFANGHFVCMPSLPAALAMVAAVGSVVGLAQMGPTLRLLERVKDPGEGPSPEHRAKARFSITFITEGAGHRCMTRVSGGDPGYGETAKMIAESAMALAQGREALPAKYGALTPAVAFGDRLLLRLPAVGIPFEVLEPPAKVSSAA
jgi:short subunit dehydrogenase-like uncharacterized protein